MGLTVLDADVLIGVLDPADAHHVRASEAVGRMLQEGRQLAASVVTHAEVLVGWALADRVAAGEDQLADLGVERVPVADDSAPRLAALRAETGQRLPDACVLLAAEQIGASEIATFDESLAAAARSRGLDVA